ncbi:MAG TPA: hypothetical protein VFF73_29030 [Planctomycetota bacterium]|nr:hypothetical protein [Planctomycetota bacterium]
MLTAIRRSLDAMSEEPGELIVLPALQALGASLATLALSVILKAELWGPGVSDAACYALFGAPLAPTFVFFVWQARSSRARLSARRALLVALIMTGALLVTGGAFLYTLCHTVGPPIRVRG